ncbi:MAG: hypothetical protein AB7V57_10235, partial [Verrucomicrobiales bacterium]
DYLADAQPEDYHEESPAHGRFCHETFLPAPRMDGCPSDGGPGSDDSGSDTPTGAVGRFHEH